MQNIQQLQKKKKDISWEYEYWVNTIDIIAVDFGIVGGMSLIVLSQTSKTLRSKKPHSYGKVERIKTRNW